VQYISGNKHLLDRTILLKSPRKVPVKRIMGKGKIGSNPDEILIESFPAKLEIIY